MTNLQKIKNIIMGALGIALGIAMIKESDGAYVAVISLLGLGFLVTGLSTLFYYFTMSQFMVGGKTSLYKGVILTDFAILTLSLTDVPKGYVVIYLIALHVFSGLVEILRALEGKRYGGRWGLKMFHGLVNLGICVACVVNLKSPGICVIIYGLGLIYSGVMTILSCLRSSTLVFVR